ncbi:MAG TPA: hypothetical protein PKK95_02610 [Vicinamibacterales bacterium]|nr:hypothetical protein [Vicinamibacterales bacterium]
MRSAISLALLLLAYTLPCTAQEPPWPEPCAQSWTCWLIWDQNPSSDHVVRYEIWSGTTYCGAVFGGRQSIRNPERWINPHNAYWPHPDDGCWEPGHQLLYVVYAVDDEGLISLNPSNAVAFGPQEWACVEAPGCERPCPVRRLPHLPECGP